MRTGESDSSLSPASTASAPSSDSSFFSSPESIELVLLSRVLEADRRSRVRAAHRLLSEKYSFGQQSFGRQSFGRQSFDRQSFGQQSFGQQSFGQQSSDRY